MEAIPTYIFAINMRLLRDLFAKALLIGGLALLLGGCTSDQPEDPFGESDPDDKEFSSLCGTLKNGAIINPINGDEGLPISILGAESSNIVIIQSQHGTERVKLHATSDNVSSTARSQGVALLDSFRGPGVFYPASRDCETELRSGERAKLGQVFTISGENLTEEVMTRGYARPDPDDPCSADQVSSCYQALYAKGEQ